MKMTLVPLARCMTRLVSWCDCTFAFFEQWGLTWALGIFPFLFWRVGSFQCLVRGPCPETDWSV
jgi:hypothetical protein